MNDLYELVLAEVEHPMLDMIMQYTRGNQTRAANMLGINRGTSVSYTHLTCTHQVV